MEKESELILELDHFQDCASLTILDNAMEDFYIRTVPYTVPPKLTQYMDEIHETRVTAMVKKKMEKILDEQTNLQIQQQVDRLVEEQMAQ
jgi:hypothetical protein